MLKFKKKKKENVSIILLNIKFSSDFDLIYILICLLLFFFIARQRFFFTNQAYLHFTGSATGNPTPQIIWKLDGFPLPEVSDCEYQAFFFNKFTFTVP